MVIKLALTNKIDEIPEIADRLHLQRYASVYQSKNFMFNINLIMRKLILCIEQTDTIYEDARILIFKNLIEISLAQSFYLNFPESQSKALIPNDFEYINKRVKELEERRTNEKVDKTQSINNGSSDDHEEINSEFNLQNSKRKYLHLNLLKNNFTMIKSSLIFWVI